MLLNDTAAAATAIVGYWGIPTSSVDWCEQNYTWSYYIAEWWNSWSNVPPFLLALGGILAAWTTANNKKHVRAAAQPPVILVAYAVLVLVFAGSFAFHATLTYCGQLLDELPMLYGQLYFHYLYSRKYQHAKSICWSLAALITLCMIVWSDSPLPLQVSFTCLSLALLVRSILIAKEMQQQKSNQILRLCALLNASACVCWLLDQSYCSYLEHWYFHAAWHLLQGLSGFVWIQFACAYEFTRTKTGFSIQTNTRFALLPYCCCSSDKNM